MYGWLKTVDFMKLGIFVEVLGTLIFGVKRSCGSGDAVVS